MRVLLVNTSERMGGAAVAANRLMEALKSSGVKVKMLVRDKSSDQTNVVALKRSPIHVWNFLWERLVILLHNHFSRKYLFDMDIANAGADITMLPEFQQADIIHLHWINQGMLSLKSLKKIIESGKPIVWTMHDMWPATGICHYARKCDYFMTQCHNCIYLASGSKKRDLSFKVFKKKKSLYQSAAISFVACSQWLESEANKSMLFADQTVTSIPNPINVNLFRPIPKIDARKRCGLPETKKIIMFGSVKISDKRKGIKYLIEASNILVQRYPEVRENWIIAIVGRKPEGLDSQFPLPIQMMGYISSERQMVDVYNAADLYVTPSLEDNLPNTIMEAMACGTPCVGFNVGGIPEMIDHLHNGYIAHYKDAEDLANGINWVLTDPNHDTLSEMCVHKVASCYSEQRVAARYIEIYNKAIE